MEFKTECPKCGSNELKIVNQNYPKAYECRKCKYNFVIAKQALIDE